MGFFGKEPIDINQTEVTYVYTGYETQGFFHVKTGGNAPNYSYGFSLHRDPNFCGGLKIDVMGCTGPIGQGVTPYTVSGSFNGEFRSKVILSASNGDFTVDVRVIPHEQADEYGKAEAQGQAYPQGGKQAKAA